MMFSLEKLKNGVKTKVIFNTEWPLMTCMSGRIGKVVASHAELARWISG